MIRATPAHAVLLAAIHELAFPAGERWDPASIAKQLVLPGVFGLFDPGGAMVLARVAAEDAEILTLAVVPERRGQGLGRALLEAAAALAAGQGAHSLFLEVSAANTAAQRLYLTADFAEVGRRPRYYPDGSDAQVLRRKIRALP